MNKLFTCWKVLLVCTHQPRTDRRSCRGCGKRGRHSTPRTCTAPPPLAPPLSGRRSAQCLPPTVWKRGVTQHLASPAPFCTTLRPVLAANCHHRVINNIEGTTVLSACMPDFQKRQPSCFGMTRESFEHITNCKIFQILHDR